MLKLIWSLIEPLVYLAETLLALVLVPVLLGLVIYLIYKTAQIKSSYGIAVAKLCNEREVEYTAKKRDFANDEYTITYECTDTVFIPDTQVNTHHKAYKTVNKSYTESTYRFTVNGEDYYITPILDLKKEIEVYYLKTDPEKNFTKNSYRALIVGILACYLLLQLVNAHLGGNL